MEKGDFIYIMNMDKKNKDDFFRDLNNSSPENKILFKKYGGGPKCFFIVSDEVPVESGSLIELLPAGCSDNIPSNFLMAEIIHPGTLDNLKKFEANKIYKVRFREKGKFSEFYFKENGGWSNKYKNVLRPVKDGLLDGVY